MKWFSVIKTDVIPHKVSVFNFENFRKSLGLFLFQQLRDKIEGGLTSIIMI